MSSSDDELFDRILQDTCRYLDQLRHPALLWADVDHHIAASHLAESLGDPRLMDFHLQAVTRLLAEIYANAPVREGLGKKHRPIIRKPLGRWRVSGPFQANRLTTSHLERVSTCDPFPQTHTDQ